MANCYENQVSSVGITLGDDVSFGCPCPPVPPCPPPPFPPFPPPPAPKPCVVDDNVPYNPATYADICKLHCALTAETVERIAYDAYLSSAIAALSGGGGHIDVDDVLSLDSVNPVQNKVITERIFTLTGEVSELSSIVSSVSGSLELTNSTVSSISSSVRTLSESVENLEEDVVTLSGIAEAHTSQISELSSNVSELSGNLAELSGWCVDEFIKDEFTDFLDIPFAKEIRGGYSDDDILLIGSKRDGMHYILPGETVPSRCVCQDGQEEFDGYQFRNIISGNGCYVATNRDSSARTNVYTSTDGINWSKKEHTIKHNDTNGNVSYSPVTQKYYHATLTTEYPEISSTHPELSGKTAYCVEVSSDLENWSILTLADGEDVVSLTHAYRAVMNAGNYLYITTVGGSAVSYANCWYLVVDLTTNTKFKEGNEFFHGYGASNGWLRWRDGNKIYFGMTQSGVNYSDRIIMTEDGFSTYSEYVINPNNKLGLEFQGTYKCLIPRSLNKYHGVYFMGTYETASPHIFMSYDMNNWHVVSTPPFGIGADMLCPFQGLLYVGYSGDLADPGYLADVRYTYHTDHLVIHGILQDLENGSGGSGGSLKNVDKITIPYNDKVVRAKVNEIIVTLGGKLDQIPDEFTDEDIKDKVNEIISAYSK